MNKNKLYFGATQISITAILLTICIISQVFKNVSVFITGPVINTCIILSVALNNLPCAIVLSIITPITAYIIAASPVMMAVPVILPLIMLGNISLAVSVFLIMPRDMKISPVNMVKAAICALIKGVVMGLTISLWLLPTFIHAESPLRAKLPVFQAMFSITQFLTACIGFVYAFIILAAIKKNLESQKT